MFGGDFVSMCCGIYVIVSVSNAAKMRSKVFPQWLCYHCAVVCVYIARFCQGAVLRSGSYVSM